MAGHACLPLSPREEARRRLPAKYKPAARPANAKPRPASRRPCPALMPGGVGAGAEDCCCCSVEDEAEGSISACASLPACSHAPHETGQVIKEDPGAAEQALGVSWRQSGIEL